MKVVTAEQMQRIDRITIQERGVPGGVLMERAGRAVAREALALAPDTVAIVTGKGNNAGDGFVAARALAEQGASVTLFMLRPESELAGDALEALRHVPEIVPRVLEPSAGSLAAALPAFDIVIDAIFGTGLAGPVREPFDQAIEAINASGAFVLSVDLPSGLPADLEAARHEPCGPWVQAALTVTMGLPKLGMLVEPGVRATGSVIVEAIGFPDDLTEDEAIQVNLMTIEDACALLPGRQANGHKGTFGSVLILAGSEGMTGAAVLAARAASRSGVGLVYSAYPAPLGAIMESHLIEPVKRPLAGSRPWFTRRQIDEAAAAARAVEAVALGPGLGRRASTGAFLRAIVERTDRPLVIDADGLRLLADDCSPLAARDAPAILTPHPGEAAALLGRSIKAIERDRLDAFVEFSGHYRAIVVLKGAQTIVTLPDGQRWINPTGNSGLAKGGSGDVLTGLIAGLLAQGLAPAEAARLGVFVHGLAGDLAAETHGVRAMLPSDIIDHLGAAFLHLERRAGE